MPAKPIDILPGSAARWQYPPLSVPGRLPSGQRAA